MHCTRPGVRHTPGETTINLTELLDSGYRRLRIFRLGSIQPAMEQHAGMSVRTRAAHASAPGRPSGTRGAAAAAAARVTCGPFDPVTMHTHVVRARDLGL